MLNELPPAMVRLAPGTKIMVADTPGAVVSEPFPPILRFPEKKYTPLTVIDVALLIVWLSLAHWLVAE